MTARPYQLYSLLSLTAMTTINGSHREVEIEYPLFTKGATYLVIIADRKNGLETCFKNVIGWLVVATGF